MRLGDYQTLRELRRSGAASLWEVEPVGGGGDGGKRAAKILQPPAFWSDEERSARVARFLARARVQEQAARAGRHWAPVHAMGEDADEAHYVTDLYPATAEQLVRKPKAVMNGAGLFRIMRGVVAGLIELTEAAGRGHGRLTAGNVLLTSENPASAAVALSDPAVEPPRDGEAGDCRAVGELLFALVMRRAPEPGEVAKASSAWRALGPRRRQWRELCNRLLDPAEPLDSLDGLRDAVARCRPPKVSSKQALRAGIAVSLVVGAVVAFSGYRIVRHKKYVKDWKELCQTSGWLPDFVRELNARGGERLKVILGGVPNDAVGPIKALAAESVVGPKEIRGARTDTNRNLEDDPPEELGNAKVVRQVTTIMAGVRAVEALRDPDKWEVLKSAQQLGAEYGRGAGTYVQYLREAADGIMGGRANLAANLAKLVEYQKWLKPLHALAGPYKRIESEENTDQQLKAEFEAAVEEVAGFSAESTAFAQVDDLARVAAGVVRGLDDLKSGRFDEKRFREERREQLAGKTKRAFMEAWAAEVPRYRILSEGENPLLTRAPIDWEITGKAGGQERVVVGRKAVKWDALLDGMAEDIAEVKDDARLAARGEEALKSLTAQRAALLRRPPLVKDKIEVDLEKFVEQATTIHQDLLKDNPAKVDEFKAGVAAEVGRLRASGDFVSRAQAAELERVAALPKWRLGRKTERVEAVKAFFRALPAEPDVKKFESATGRAWAIDLAALAKRQWDDQVRRAIGGVLSEGKEAEAPALEAQAQSTRKTFEGWLGRLEQLGSACMALEDGLNDYPLASEMDSAGSKTISDLRGSVSGGNGDAEILKVLEPVIARADDFIKTASRPPKELHDVVARGRPDGLPRHLESRLAAWRGADRQGLPLGPANDVRQALLTELGGASNKAAAGRGAKVVNDVWRDIARTEIAAPAMGTEMAVLAEAVKLLDAKPAPPLTLDLLDEAGRFNVSVYRVVRAAAAKAVDSEVGKRVADARQAAAAVRGAGGAVAGGPRAGVAVDELEAWLDRAKPPSDAPRIDQVGPAGEAPKRKGWRFDAKFEGPGVAYTNDGLRVRLEFFDLPDAECYMCKTEVSIELFAAVMSAASPGAIKDVRAPEGGLMAWTIKPGPTIEPTADWFTPNPNQKGVNYVPNVGDLPPPAGRGRSPLYPLQRISPKVAELVAAELNCQIPTVRQWEAALAEELKLNPTGLWNVRDQKSWQNNINGGAFPGTWGVVGDIAGQKAGLNDFWLTDPDGAFPRKEKGVKPYEDDGHLMFQMVDPAAPGAEPPGPWARVGKGARFDHIIGNVAEYVVTEESPKTYLAAGNSALSPQLPLNEHVRLSPERARLGFPDVGIRLAFKRPVRAYYVRLNENRKSEDQLFINRSR